MILVLVDHILFCYASSFFPSSSMLFRYDAAFFDDGMTLLIMYLNMMYPSLMLQKTAAAEQLDDIHVVQEKRRITKKKGNMKSGTIEQEKK